MTDLPGRQRQTTLITPRVRYSRPISSACRAALFFFFFFFFFLIMRRPPRSPLFPYPPLFRSTGPAKGVTYPHGQLAAMRDAVGATYSIGQSGRADVRTRGQPISAMPSAAG